jgi:Pentapeptide repeats (8 copies)
VAEWFGLGTAAVTALAALIGGVLAVPKFLEERRRQSQAAREQNFASVTSALGSERREARAGAAAALLSFSDGAGSVFNNQVFLLALAYLRLHRTSPEERPINDLLVTVLERALPGFMRSLGTGSREERHLDLNHSFLRRIDLSGFDLGSEVDIGFADLTSASLIKTKMFRVRGFGATLDKACLTDACLVEGRLHESWCLDTDFDRAVMYSVKLRGAHLVGAKFHQAQLQSAHFDGADLRGAVFKGADLNDAFFGGAIFDSVALETIQKARNWRRAHFDPVIRKALGLPT